MNIYQARWVQFKKEIIPIVFLSALHIWLSYKSQAGLTVAVLGVLFIICIVTCADMLTSRMIYTDRLPGGITIKRVNGKLMALFIIVFLFLAGVASWYTGFHALSDYYYTPGEYVALCLIVGLLVVYRTLRKIICA